MTSRAKISKSNGSTAAWLQPHRKRFLEGLTAQGYARCSLRNYDRAIVGLFAAIEKRGLVSDDLAGRQIERLREAVLDGFRPSARTCMTFCLDRFIDHLVEAGVAKLPEVAAKSTDSARSPARRICDLSSPPTRSERGDDLSLPQLSEPLHDLPLRRDARQTQRHHARRHRRLPVQDQGRGKPYRDKTPPSHLRNLFRFLFWSGKTKRDLANSIPRVAQPRQSQLPRYLKPEEIEQLIDAVWSDDPIGRRNYAMLLLIARLGLRAPEVIAIQLDDIDWRAGTILIRGKGKRHDRMPLPEDVGKAIVDYIRNGRRRPVSHPVRLQQGAVSALRRCDRS